MSRMPEPRTVSLLDRPPLKEILASLPAAPAPETKAAKPEPEKPKATTPAAPKPKRAAPRHDHARLAAIAKHVFVIEDDIPLPIGKRTGSLAERLPFDQLKVGQSFLIPSVGTSTAGTWIKRWETRLKDREFARAREGDGMRVWRVK